ncbi:type II toxin-antitoxin system VapC family toxin [Nocardia sp. NPDC046473]|uniref:type II toxin-antitoxin system VapC family toxin n=1 Tax=Nocardia sp. NPDC046473 TaxID=3155733 RepID=UPI0033C5A8AE
MILYLDTSAIITKVVGRKHAADLDRFLNQYPTATPATSTIGFVESVRECDRLGSYPMLMREMINEYASIPVNDRIRDLAAYLPGGLKSLDAIHVASATQLGSELVALVTYDKTMATVARQHGLPIAMPGID